MAAENVEARMGVAATVVAATVVAVMAVVATAEKEVMEVATAGTVELTVAAGVEAPEVARAAAG